MAVFKPTKILDFAIEAVDRGWNKVKLAKLEAERIQGNLFKQPEDPFDVVKKLQYKFSFVFEDSVGKKSKLMIEDWEIGQLYWNCLQRHQGDEKKATEDVKNKYFTDFAQTKDLYFILGTSQVYHFNSHNPFMIIGTIHPKIEVQSSLF